ncbi:MAG TPA: superoxide dismutase [Leptolyngbyaceae cyanobacterium M33_DOE_097]|uniref:Superoxide dismutase n=1 Tax=Oscillatoriales cyanobacterium SpSt-418 TaxID=2282169 RepID=A0A7C3PCJ2_9CYAN|nr:superoxide dismutase [Leptolyngbyaceae cyanobacterium M33_DOE_097]
MKQLLHRSTRFLLAGVALLVLLISCATAPQAQTPSPTAQPAAVASPGGELSAYPAQLPPLPYEYGALAKAIDAETMKLHHDRHHASYVNNLNEALKPQSNLQNRSVEALLRDLNSLPEDIRTTVRNNGGGHLNHTIFWQLMSPNGGGQPTGEVAQAITQTFGSFDNFKKEFNEAGGDRFGSGWVWLVRNGQGQLQIVSTPNQDNPIMEGNFPIMGNDVWEHAYYLRYQNRRAEYLNNWWNVVNWQEVNRRFQLAAQQ